VASPPAGSRTFTGRRWTAGAGRDVSSARRSGPRARPIPALSSPRCPQPRSTRGGCMR
jgi:hypothetical protein